MANLTRAQARRIFLTCMAGNNCTLGLNYGSFGALLVSNEHAFGVTRSTISFGMSAATVTMALSALVMGNLVRKMTPRVAIACGVLTTSIALAGLGLTSNIIVAMTMWALLGFGMALSAVLGPVQIAAELFPDRAGKFLAIVNLPVFLFIGPSLVTALLPLIGRTGTYLLLASLLLPVLALVLWLPSTRATSALAPTLSDGPLSPSRIITRADFWLISFGIAVTAGTGTAYAVHAIPFAQSRGLSLPAAALMLSVYSGAGLAGVPLCGWLADRIGPPRTLAVAAAVQCLCWAGFALAPASAFFFLSATLGAATTPLTMLHGAAMSRLFGIGGAGQAVGYGYAIKLPILFGAAPAVGYAYTVMLDYRPALLIVSAVTAFAVLLLTISGLKRGQYQA